MTNQTDVIDEGIIQLCLVKRSKSLYWRYVYQYFTLCLNPSKFAEDLDLNACRELAFKAATSGSENAWQDNKDWTDSKVCWKSTFSNAVNVSTSLVHILDDQVDTTGYLRNFEFIPALLIEDYLVRGSMNPISLASSICDSILNPPASVCNNLQDLIAKFEAQGLDPSVVKPEYEVDVAPPKESEEGPSFLFKITFGLAILLGSMLFLGVAVFLAKKLLDKFLPGLLHTEVDINVENYVRIRSEEKTNKSPGETEIDANVSTV